MRRRTIFLLIGAALAPFFLANYARAADSWSGRLALTVPDKPDQSFSGSFELSGTATRGELLLFNPLGNILALVSWRNGNALLTSNGQTNEFASIDSLMVEVTGSAIPVVALFSWLNGVNAPIPGWRADLSQFAQGRVTARRIDPPADLRIILENK